MRLLRHIWIPAACLVPLLQMQIDARLGEYRAQEEVLYVWSGEQWRRLLPGFENVMADIYWLRTVQYYGGTRRFAREKKFELLQPLLEITVALDPRLEIAYRYGATFLCEDPPLGAGRPKAGVALLQKGASRLPRDWLLQQNLAFFTWFYLHDAPAAAAAAERASREPGAPDWLRTLAADMLVQGGERDMARRLWHQIYETSEGFMQEGALIQLRRLDAQDQMRAWNQVLRAYRRRHGAWPPTLAALGAGLPLEDPSGVAWVYAPSTGEVRVSWDSMLRHVEMDRLAAELVAQPD